MQKRMNRIVASGLSILLLFTQVLFAHSPEVNFWKERSLLQKNSILSQTKDIKRSFAANNAPQNGSFNLAQFGSIRKSPAIQTSNGKTIIYIQDIHGQPEAQKNIAAMIGSILEKEPDALVALEGAAGDIPLEHFRGSSVETNREVGSFFLNTGLITGAEYAGFAAKKKPFFYGVEDKDIYLQNVAAVRAALIGQEERIEEVVKQSRALQRRKENAYTAFLLELDREGAAYRDGTLSIGDYLATLAKNIPPSSYPTLSKFNAAWAVEKKLDMVKAEFERNQFLSRLTAKLSKDDFERLMQRSQALQAGQLAYPDYYRSLKEMAARMEVRLSDTSEFEKYLEYVLAADSIVPEALLSELNLYENEIWVRQNLSSEQRRLFEKTKELSLIEKLVRLTMSPVEWEQYNKSYAGSSTLAPFEDFYRLAQARNAVLAGNLKNKITSSSSKVVVLVAGGFHSDGVSRILANENMSLIMVSPKLTMTDRANKNDYLQIFTREKTPLEKLFEAPKISIVQTLATHPIGENPVAPVVEELSQKLPQAFRDGSVETRDYSIVVEKNGLDKKNNRTMVLEGATENGVHITVYKKQVPLLFLSRLKKIGKFFYGIPRSCFLWGTGICAVIVVGFYAPMITTSLMGVAAVLANWPFNQEPNRPAPEHKNIVESITLELLDLGQSPHVKSNPALVALNAQTLSHMRNISFSFRREKGFDDYPHEIVLKGPYPRRPMDLAIEKYKEFMAILAAKKTEMRFIAPDPERKKQLIKEQKDFIKGLTNDPLQGYQGLRERLLRDGPNAAFPEFRSVVEYLELELQSDPLAAKLCQENPHLAAYWSIALKNIQDLPRDCPYLTTFYAIEKAVEFFDVLRRTEMGDKAPPLYHSAHYEYYLHSLMGEVPDHIALPTMAPLGSTEFLKLRGVPIGFLGVHTESIRVDGFHQTPYEMFIHDVNHSRRMYQLLKEAANKKGIPEQAYYAQSTNFIQNVLLPLFTVSKSDTPRTKGLKLVLKMLLFEYLHEESFPADPDILRVELLRAPRQRVPFERIEKDREIVYYTDVRPTPINYTYRKLAHDYYDEPEDRMASIVPPEARTREVVVEAAAEVLKALGMEDIPMDALMEFVSADDFPNGSFRAGLQRDIDRRPHETIPLGHGTHPSLAPLLEMKDRFQKKIQRVVPEKADSFEFIHRHPLALPLQVNGLRVGVFAASDKPLIQTEITAIRAAADSEEIDELVVVLSRSASIEELAVRTMMLEAAVKDNRKISIAVSGGKHEHQFAASIQARFHDPKIHLAAPLSAMNGPSPALLRLFLADGETDLCERWLAPEAMALIRRWALYRDVVPVDVRRQAYRNERGLIDGLLAEKALRHSNKWQEARKDIAAEDAQNPLRAMRAVYSYYFPEVRNFISSLVKDFPHRVFMRSMRIGEGLDNFHEAIIDRLIAYEAESVPALKDFPHRYTSSGSEETIREFMTTLALRGVKKIYVLPGEYEGYRAVSQTRGIETVEVPLDADVQMLEPGWWFISNPSARDGNMLPDDFVNKVCAAGHKVFYDLSYLSSTDFHKFDLSHPNIAVAAISFSKPYGLFYYRQGFTFSREPIDGLSGNIWFKNIFSLMIAETVMKNLAPRELVKRYRSLQKKIIAELNERFGLGLQASDVVILAHRPNDAGLNDEQKKMLARYRRGDGYRLTLTPYFLEEEGLPSLPALASADFQGSVAKTGPLLEGHQKSRLIDPAIIDSSQDTVNVPWAKPNFFYAKKVQGVFAEKATPGEVVETRVKGFLVTTNVAQEGDVKITTHEGDQYCLSAKKFAERYHDVKSADGTYRPKEQVVKMLEVTEPVRFLAPWGEWQYVPAGSVIAFWGKGDIYGIHRDSYRAAYVRVNKREGKKFEQKTEEYQRLSSPELLSWVLTHADALPATGPPQLMDMIELVRSVEESLPSLNHALSQDLNEPANVTVKDILNNFTAADSFMGASFLAKTYFRKKRIVLSVVEANRALLNDVFESERPGARRALLSLFKHHLVAHNWNPVIHAHINQSADWQLESLQDHTVMFSSVFKLTYVDRNDSSKRVELFIKRDNDQGRLVNDVTYAHLQNKFLSGPVQSVPAYLQEDGDRKGVLVSFNHMGGPLRKGVEELIDRKDDRLTNKFVRRMAEHAALGDIFGRNDRKMSNTSVEILRDRIGQMVDFDNLYLLDGPQNYDWILQDIVEGVSEINVLGLLSDGKPKKLKSLLTEFAAAYLEVWGRVKKEQMAAEDVLGRFYSEEKAVHMKKTLAARLNTDSQLVLLDVMRAYLRENRARLLYKELLEEMVKKAPHNPALSDLRKYLSSDPLNKNKYAFQQVLADKLVEKYSVFLKGRPRWSDVSARLESLGTQILGEKRIRELKKEVSVQDESAEETIRDVFRHVAMGTTPNAPVMDLSNPSAAKGMVTTLRQILHAHGVDVSSESLEELATAAKQLDSLHLMPGLTGSLLRGGIPIHISISEDLTQLVYSLVVDDSQVFGDDGAANFSKLKLDPTPLAVIPSSFLIYPIDYIAKHFQHEQLEQILLLMSQSRRYTEYDGITVSWDGQIDHDVWTTSIDTIYFHRVLKQAGVLKDPSIKVVTEVGSGGGHLSSLIAREVKSLLRVMATDISLFALMATARNVINYFRRSKTWFKGYLGKGIQTLEAESDLIVINPPYVPTPPWETKTEGDPYRGTGLIREIFEIGVDKLNPNNPSASIVMNLSNLADEDVEKYIEEFGNRLEITALGEPLWVPFKIGKVNAHWLEWLKQRGLREEENPQLDRPKYWHQLRIIQIRPRTKSAATSHKRARGAYPGYPDRFPVPDDKVSWNVPYRDYKPVNFTSPSVLDSDRSLKEDGWADPADYANVEEEVRARESFAGPIKFDPKTKLPLNPRGRTGMTGRGNLGKYGPNLAVDSVVTRLNPATGRLQVAIIKRKATGEWAIPGGFVDRGEDPRQAFRREFSEEALDLKTEDAATKHLLDQLFTEGKNIRTVYIDDPRNTDNAWIDSIAMHFHATESVAHQLVLKAGDDAGDVRWVDFEDIDEGKIPLYGSHRQLVRQTVDKLFALPERKKPEFVPFIRPDRPAATNLDQLKINPETDVVVAVDVQPTFMPQGGLPVVGGDKTVPNILKVLKLFPKENRFASQDWHPKGHVSLASSYKELAPFTYLTYDAVKDWSAESNGLAEGAAFDVYQLQAYLKKVGGQMLWPDHGLQGTKEAELHPDLNPDDFVYIQKKGMNPAKDSYSAFFDNGGEDEDITGLFRAIKERKPSVKRVFFVGLAYDFCVGWSAQDATEKLGLEAIIIKDATRPVAVPSDSGRDYLGSVPATDLFFNKYGVKVVPDTETLIEANSADALSWLQRLFNRQKIKKNLHPEKLPLLNITMPSLELAAEAFWQDKKGQRSWFDLTAPSAPHGGSYLVAAGLEEALAQIKHRRFTTEHIEGLRRTGEFSEAFLDYLLHFEFSGHVQAVPEGTVVPAGAPLVRIFADPIEAALIQDLLQNRIGAATVVATKTARIMQAVRGEFIDKETAERIKTEFGIDVYQERDVADFGQRRAQGLGDLQASRAAYIGGAKVTSNVKAGKLFNIPVSGTMAHLWVQFFARIPTEEPEAFRVYAEAFPDSSIFLIDTFDTLQGARNAALVAKEMEAKGHKLLGVRLDSGDLAVLSRQVRKILNDAGLSYVKIFASDDLDEEKITQLLLRGAAIDAFGVGTNLITGGKQAFLNLELKPAGTTGKLEEFWRDGKRVRYIDLLSKMQDRATRQIKRMDPRQKDKDRDLVQLASDKTYDQPRPIEDDGTALIEDLYHLTMGQAIFKKGRHNARTTFDYFYRTPPYKDSNHIIVSGLPQLLEDIRNFRFSADDIEYLRGLNKFENSFLDSLESFKFRGDIVAQQEGTRAYPHEPILRVTGTFLEAALVETLILKRMNFNSLIATWADILVKKNGEFVEDGLSIAHGQSHLEVSRSAHLGGSAATTNVDAYLRYGVPLARRIDPGTRLASEIATGGPKSSLGGVYKLASAEDEPRIKLSETELKTSLPENKVLWRVKDAESHIVRRVIALEGETIPLAVGETAAPLLVPAVAEGRMVYQQTAVKETADSSITGAELSSGLKNLRAGLIGQARGAMWIEHPTYAKMAAVVELSRNILLVLYVLLMPPAGQNMLLAVVRTAVVMASIPLIFKYAHVPGRGWEVTRNNLDIQKMTKLIAWSTFPLILLPVSLEGAIGIYALMLVTVTAIHHRIDNPATKDVRVAMAQVNVTIGDFDGIVAKVKQRIDEAAGQKVDLLIFQEALLTGYPAQDVWLNPEFQRKQDDALRDIRDYTKRKNITVVIGAVRFKEGLIYNSGYVLKDGSVVKIVDKHILARDEVYSDPRQFTPGAGPLKAALIQDGGNIFEVNGVKFGLSICEDIWHDEDDVVKQLKTQGATDIINISGSHFYAGRVMVLKNDDPAFDPAKDFEAQGVRYRLEGSKLQTREALLGKRARENGVNMYYVNSVGGQDEIIIDGHSYVFGANGEARAFGRHFAEDMMVVQRNRDGAVMALADEITRGRAELEPIEQLYQALVLGTADYIRKAGMERVVIGLSGGIDSALVLAIARDAFDQLGLPVKNIIGITMPSEYSSEGSWSDARKQAESFGITFLESPIKGMVNLFDNEVGASILAALGKAGMTPSDVHRGLADENKQPRFRASILYFVTNLFPNSMLLTTGNDTEMRRGYSTIGGDLEGGFAPLGNVNKLNVYALAIHRNRLVARGELSGIIPDGSIYKAPSAELKPGQIDTAALGFPYHLMVLFDQYYSRSNGDIDEVIRRRNDIDVRKELNDEDFARLIYESIRLYERSEFKRRQAAPSIVASKGAHTFVVRRPIATKLYVDHDDVLRRVRHESMNIHVPFKSELRKFIDALAEHASPIVAGGVQAIIYKGLPALNATPDSFQSLRKAKTATNGGFEERLVLVRGYNPKTRKMVDIAPDKQKAIRDNIPGVIAANIDKSDLTPEEKALFKSQILTRTVSQKEWAKLMRQKIREEMNEVDGADTPEALLEELGDLLDVVEAYRALRLAMLAQGNGPSEPSGGVLMMIALAGPLQKDLLSKGFDFTRTKEMVNRRVSKQRWLEPVIRWTLDLVSPRATVFHVDALFNENPDQALIERLRHVEKKDGQRIYVARNVSRESVSARLAQLGVSGGGMVVIQPKGRIRASEILKTAHIKHVWLQIFTTQQDQFEESDSVRFILYVLEGSRPVAVWMNVLTAKVSSSQA